MQMRRNFMYYFLARHTWCRKMAVPVHVAQCAVHAANAAATAAALVRNSRRPFWLIAFLP